MRTRLLLARATLSLLALTMLVGVAAQAQEADKIIGQCLKAEGGRKALGKIQTLALEGTFPGAEGSPGTFTFYLKSPNRYYSEPVSYTHLDVYKRQDTCKPPCVIYG